MSIRSRISTRLDDLEHRLKSDDHLKLDGVGSVELLISSISKFWSVLTEEERDFVAAARFAVEEQVSWTGASA